MRFAGLFDCEGLKAHGEAVLLYEHKFGKFRNKKLMEIASSPRKGTSYNDSATKRFPLLNPLNYASNIHNCSKIKTSKKNKNCKKRPGYVAVTEMESLGADTGLLHIYISLSYYTRRIPVVADYIFFYVFQKH